jgi:ribonuclease PH
MTNLLYCNAYGPAQGRGDARYAFKQAANETLGEAAIRAAQIVLATGVNKVAHYTGTNHVMANNAAFAFSQELLQDLKGDDDSSAEVVASVELLDEFRKRVQEQYDANNVDKVAQARRLEQKPLAYAHIQKIANDMRESADKRLLEINRIAQFIPKRK